MTNDLTGTPPTGEGELIDELLDVLYRQATALETLVMRTTISALVTQAWETSVFGFASDELEDARIAVSELDVLRDSALMQICERWGVSGTSLTLKEISERCADETQREQLQQLRERLWNAAREIEDVQARTANVAAGAAPDGSYTS